MLTHRAATILGDIPNEWEAKLLCDVLLDETGGDWGDDTGDQAVMVLRSTNFTDSGFLSFDDVERRHFTAKKSAGFSVKQGDILVERSGGGPTQPVGRIGVVQNDLPGFWFSNFVQLLRPNPDEIEPEFLAWVLHELNRSGIVNRLQHQTTQMRNLDYRDYLRILVPKPQNGEAAKIAEAIRTACSAVTATEAKLVAAQRLKTALMQQLFTHGLPGRHTEFQKTKWMRCPVGWEIKLLRGLAEIESGFTMGRDLTGNELVRLPYLTVVNVQAGHIDLSSVVTVEVKVSEFEGLLLEPGDVVMTEGGDRDKLGRGCIWRGEIERCVYQNHIFRIRFHPDTYLPELFHFLLQSWEARNYFAAHAKQTSNLCSINKRELRRFPVPMPKPDEQEEMLALLKSAEDNIEAVKREVQALQRLKTSLLQNLLTGKVRVSAVAGAMADKKAAEKSVEAKM